MFDFIVNVLSIPEGYTDICVLITGMIFIFLFINTLDVLENAVLGLFKFNGRRK